MSSEAKEGKAYLVIVVVTGKNDKLNVSARSVRDVVSLVSPAPTADEVMQAKNELKQELNQQQLNLQLQQQRR